MADAKAKLLEDLKDEYFLTQLIVAKTPEEGCALLATKGYDVTTEDFEVLVSGIDDNIPDELVEAVAGGADTWNDNWGGFQVNRTTNISHYYTNLVDASTNISVKYTENNITINNN